MIIFLGSAVELAILSFLLFLWLGSGSAPGGAAASAVWRFIMLKGWVTQAVTLSSVLLRAAVDLQSLVCTGLAAALMLEACDVQYRDISLFSIARAVNAGPWTIIYRVIQSPSMFLRSFPAAMLAILFLSTIGAQFSSTLLVSDLRPIPLVADSASSRTPIVGTRFEILGSGEVAVWQQPSAVFPSFAELRRNTSAMQQNLADTGNVTRAFMPFTPAQRQRLRSYDGMAVAHKSRAVCTAPNFVDTKFLVYGGVAPLQLNDTGFLLRGRVSVDPLLLNGLSIAPSIGSGTNFTCGVPLSTGPVYSWDATPSPKTPKLSYVPTSICSLDTARVISRSAPFSLLVLNITSDPDVWGKTVQDFNETTLQSPTNDGDWTHFTLGANFSISASLCFLQSSLGLSYAKLDSGGDPLDVAIEYDSTSESWNSADVIRMMGIPSPNYSTHQTTPDERGVMELSQPAPVPVSDFEKVWVEVKGNNSNQTLQHQLVNNFLRIFFELDIPSSVLGFSPGINRLSTTPKGLNLCATCSYYVTSESADQVNPFWAVVFQDIIRQQQGHVAWAVHTLFFWAYQTLYYNALINFDIGGNSTVAFSQPSIAPQGYAGLAAVIGIVVINLICTMIITGLFLVRTRYSFYGSSWHAVGQVVSPETEMILEHSRHRTDHEVEAIMFSQHLRKTEAGLYRPRGADGVVVVKKSSTL